MEHISINEWLMKFDAGDFDSPDCETQIKAGWFDWFCKDSSLRNKTYKLAKKVKQIAKSEKVDIDNSYVFFKNNCPVNGSLYDDFRICDLETGNVIWTIVPASGFNTIKGKATVWGAENAFDAPLVEGTWKDVKNYFGV